MTTVSFLLNVIYTITLKLIFENFVAHISKINFALAKILKSQLATTFRVCNMTTKLIFEKFVAHISTMKYALANILKSQLASQCAT